MLIGVGGSGKQSLSKLSASICGYDIRQLSVTSKFTVMDLKENLKEYYRAGAFLHTLYHQLHILI